MPFSRKCLQLHSDQAVWKFYPPWGLESFLKIPKVQAVAIRQNGAPQANNPINDVEASHLESWGNLPTGWSFPLLAHLKVKSVEGHTRKAYLLASTFFFVLSCGPDSNLNLKQTLV